MFYVTTLEHEIVLEPVYFGPKLRVTIVRLLKEEVEGLVSRSVCYRNYSIHEAKLNTILLNL